MLHVLRSLHHLCGGLMQAQRQWQALDVLQQHHNTLDTGYFVFMSAFIPHDDPHSGAPSQ